jgi:hypothetical protein
VSGRPVTLPGGKLDETEHTDRYEALRAYVAGRRDPASRDGLVVLLRRGVAAWMEAWSGLPEPPPRPVPAQRQQRPPWPDPASAEVIRVLAAMTLTHIQEVHA